jgi:hypothetical protein
MSGYFGLVIAALLWIAVDQSYGPIGDIRLVGGFFMGFAIYAIWIPQLEIRLGQHSVGQVGGWKKGIVLVLVASIGIAVLVYAPEITCLDSRYRHLCR